MGQYIEVCTNPQCGHAKETHFEERVCIRDWDAARGEWVDRWVTMRRTCLGMRCDCTMYRAPKW